MTPRGRLILYGCLWAVAVVGAMLDLCVLESNSTLGIVLLIAAVCLLLIPSAIMIYQWEVYLREQKELRRQLDGFRGAVETLRQQLPGVCEEGQCLPASQAEAVVAGSRQVMAMYALSAVAVCACFATSLLVQNRVLSICFLVLTFLMLFLPFTLMLKDWEKFLDSSHQTNGRLDAIREELQEVQRELSLLRGGKAENHPPVDSGKDA